MRCNATAQRNKGLNRSKCKDNQDKTNQSQALQVWSHRRKLCNQDGNVGYRISKRTMRADDAMKKRNRRTIRGGMLQVFGGGTDARDDDFGDGGAG